MLWTWPTRRNWNLWDDFERLQRDMDRLFNAGTRAASGPLGDFPAVNIWAGENDALLTAELPGVNPDDIDVTVKDNTVTIRGSRQPETLKEGQAYMRRERGTGSFVRSFTLPFDVDAKNVSAQYRMGILQVTLPRAEADKPKKITVKAG